MKTNDVVAAIVLEHDIVKSRMEDNTVSLTGLNMSPEVLRILKNVSQQDDMTIRLIETYRSLLKRGLEVGKLTAYDALTHTRICTPLSDYAYIHQACFLRAEVMNYLNSEWAGDASGKEKKREFIALNEALDRIAAVIEAPAAMKHTYSYKRSKAAGMLHQALHNNDSTRPKWFEIEKETQLPLIKDSIAVEGMAIVKHVSGWYAREHKLRTDHVTAFIAAGIDPTTQPVGRDVNDGQWSYQKRGFQRETQIGFNACDLLDFLDKNSLPHTMMAWCNSKGINTDWLRDIEATAAQTKIAHVNRAEQSVSISSVTIKELNPERAAEWLRKRGWSIGQVHWLFNGWEPVSKLVGNYIPPANAGDDTDRLRLAIATRHLVSNGNDESEALYSPADVIRVCEDEDFGDWQFWKNMVEKTSPAAPHVESTKPSIKSPTAKEKTRATMLAFINEITIRATNKGIEFEPANAPDKQGFFNEMQDWAKKNDHARLSGIAAIEGYGRDLIRFAGGRPSGAKLGFYASLFPKKHR